MNKKIVGMVSTEQQLKLVLMESSNKLGIIHVNTINQLNSLNQGVIEQ